MAKLRKAMSVIRIFGEVAGPIMDEALSQDRCLNASRITIDTLRNFGIESRPLSVEALAANKPMLEAQSNAFDYEHMTPEEVKVAQAKGAWMVQTDLVGSVGGWPGHLVVVSSGILIDASAGQFSRPARNLYVPQVVTAPLSAAFTQGKGNLIHPLPEGGILAYKLRRNDRSYIHTPGYQRSPWNNAMVAKLIRAIRIKLVVNPELERRVGGKNR
jgi:hypothetical protein